MDFDRPQRDRTHLPSWARSWQVRTLGVCVGAILLAWLTVALLAFWSDQDRVIGALFPN